MFLEPFTRLGSDSNGYHVDKEIVNFTSIGVSTSSMNLKFYEIRVPSSL